MAKTELFTNRIFDEAIVWHAKLHRDRSDEAVWRGFTAWLEADAEHRAAFDLIEDLHRAFEELPLDALRETSGAGRTRRAGLWAWAAGLGAICLVLALGWRFIPRPEAGLEQATAIGERKTIALADGSTVDLNTNSRLKIFYGPAERRIELVRGEALFNVMHDAHRPFVVASGKIVIRDIGTVFDVRRDLNSTAVTVAEGRIAVATRAQTAELAAGETLLVDETQNAPLRATQDAGGLTWRQGFLTYQDAPLSAVVADLNRYFPDPILLADEATRRQRFSGVVRLDDKLAVVKSLTQLLPLEAGTDPAGHTILRRRE